MGKSKKGSTVFTVIMVLICCALLVIFAPKIWPVLKEKIGSKKSLKEAAGEIDKVNEKINKNIKKAGDGMGKGIDKLRM
ncbi:MAG: hypothetical protein FWH43_04125 [Endomicrobia bacterium]|nr:hypothetical protein [Endomicrobiia bacterium]